MSWVTVIWSMIASACLTLGAIYWMVWSRNRTAWAHLLFAATAASTAAFTFCELRQMRAGTPGELLAAMRWTHVALLCLLVSTVWFVTLYLGAGRRWLAWTVSGLRALYLLVAFLVWGNVNYLEITSLQHMQFLGDSVTVFKGIRNPWMLFGYVTMVLILIFVADASVTAWRRGERRKALMVGGSVEFFLLLGTVQAALIHWAHLPIPVFISPFYLGLVAVMGYELSRDVLRASQLVHELQRERGGAAGERSAHEPGRRDRRLWHLDSRSRARRSVGEREVAGLVRLRPVRAPGFRPHAATRAPRRSRPPAASPVAWPSPVWTAAATRSEFRLALPDGATRWISSQSRVEFDAAGQPVLMRGASRDVTAAQTGRGGNAAPPARDRPRRTRLDDGPARRVAGARDQPAARGDPAQRRGGGAVPAAAVAGPRRDPRDSRRHPRRRRAGRQGHRPHARAAQAPDRSTRGGSTWATLVAEVAALVRVDAATRQVKVDVEVPGDLPQVRATACICSRCCST